MATLVSRSRFVLAAVAVTSIALVPTFRFRASASTSTPAPIKVQHVFQIVLENEEEPTAFPGTGTELDRLATQGVFIPNYYGTGHASLDNYLAMISGQAQFSSTSQDCPIYKNASGTVDARGFYLPVMPQDTGCVYPTGVKTLPDQLAATGQTWKGYMQDMGKRATRETSPCGQPKVAGVAVDPNVGGPDGTQLAEAGDQYAMRHNPFPYFHSLIDHPLGSAASPCTSHVVPLTGLANDLTTNQIATWNLISPNLCDDGHDAPCKGPGAEGANPGAGGLVSANAFLARLVPTIQASKAYRQGGLILITFDEGSSDASCCGESAFSTGGGRVGAVVLSPTIHRHVSTCTYNHFSLLRTWEDIFHLGYLAHAGAVGLVPLTRELTANTNPCQPR